MSNYITLHELSNLLDQHFVSTRKIDCIKLLRQITGEGLKESKEFFEQKWQPTILGKNKRINHIPEVTNIPPDIDPSKLPPPMFLVGHTYKQVDGATVLILGTSNTNTLYETTYSMTSHGDVIHRYNRRDFGRVTGSSMDGPSPLNLRIPE
ncbi:MAG: ribosomal protein L7/L12 [Actinobacteria bacterium]|nr:ribosomal protein L7/L12 [Actinomycetota bacterium]MCA1807002.1 ribosomal protein L7/L12 [Actinomycetota bacterium]